MATPESTRALCPRQGGTLVNAVLHHCSIPAMVVPTGGRPGPTPRREHR